MVEMELGAATTHTETSMTKTTTELTELLQKHDWRDLLPSIAERPSCT
jgi:hypothetical protein